MDDEIPEGSKRCTGCGTVMPEADFPADRKGRNGKAARCRPCRNKATKAYQTGLEAERREYNKLRDQRRRYEGVIIG